MLLALVLFRFLEKKLDIKYISTQIFETLKHIKFDFSDDFEIIEKKL